MLRTTHNPELRSPAELVCLVLPPDPLRSGQGRGDPLQHHGSRCRSAAERHLQHRPHQRQHVCHAAPRQRGQGLFPCKNKPSLVLPPHCPSSVSTHLALPFHHPLFVPSSVSGLVQATRCIVRYLRLPGTDETGALCRTMMNASEKHTALTSAVNHRSIAVMGGGGEQSEGGNAGKLLSLFFRQSSCAHVRASIAK